jgi:hydroxymethylpyrimidine/phosphomethylpyrimidine kinase
MRAHLLSVATVLTPNLPECAALLGRPVPENEAGMMAAGQELQQLGASWVLIKGGHRADGSVDDWLAGPDGEGHWLRGQRIDTQNTHGTGCTLSSAIAAFLAQGKPMSAAVSEAKSWLIKALERSQDLAVGDGTGHGPVHHAHAWW